MKKATLVLGAAPRVAVTIARSLRRIGVPCVVGTFSAKSSALGSNAAHRSVRLPHPIAGAPFIKALTSLIETENIDTMFPGSDVAMVGIGDHYELLSELVYPGCPPPDVMAGAFEKQRTFEAARSCGIELPLSYVAPTLADLDALRGEIHFPVIAKRRSAAVIGPFKIRHYFSYEALRAEYVSSPSMGAETILQRYDGGEGVGLAVIVRDGQVFAPFQYRSLRELPTTGGVSCLVEAEKLDHELLERTAAMLRAMRWDGVAMVEFMRDRETHACRLLEVNGRYWGCLALALQSGLDYPAYEWRFAHGRDPGIAAGYRVGTRSRWTGGVIRRLGGVGGEAHERLVGTSRFHETFVTALEFLPPARSALWSWHDPLPAFWDGAAAIAGLLRDLWESVARILRRHGDGGVIARARSAIVRS
jgi:predicted ATP-grasp superfamily ATP-dependent carboligase